MTSPFRLFRRWLRRDLRERTLPADLSAILEANVPLARRLGPEDRAELESLVQVFLEEKTFEGCGGLVMDDEIRVTIAAHACLLLLRRDTDVYPDLDTILVYPSTYRAPSRRQVGPVVVESDDVRLGESWTRGVVVLSWDAVERGASDPGDGHNVVLHELAHQLDQQSGAMDGAPVLGARARYATWARVLGAEFDEHVARVHAGRATDIDAYGATSPPEFFAVVTEMFCEKPRQLQARHPELYAAFADFYRQDPASLPPV